MIRRAFSLLVTLTVLFTVLVAAALVTARLWIPAVSNYRSEIETRAADFLHAAVRINNVEAAWRGLGPVIKLGGIAVSDPANGEVLLEVDQIWLAVDMWSLISEQELRPAGVSIIGTSLDLVQDENGHTRLKNFTSTTPPGDVARWLLGQPRISLLQSSINLYRGGEDDDPRYFSDINVSLKNSDTSHRASGRVRLPEQLGIRLDFQADLTGSVDHDPWQGRVYVRGMSLSLDEVTREIKAYAAIPFSFSGTVDARLWFDITDSRLGGISAEVDGSGIRVGDAGVSGAIAFDAERLSGLIAWRQEESTQRLSIEHLSITRNGEMLREMDLSLAMQQLDDGTQSISCIAEHVDLQDASRLLMAVPVIDVGLRAQLAALSPEGVLNGVHVSVSRQGGEITGLSFQGRFHDFGNRAWKGIPGFHGLDGKMHGTADQGAVELYSRNTLIDEPGFFNEPLDFERIKGIVQWQRFTGGLRIGAAEISLRADDMEARSRLILDIPAGKGQPYLDMQVSVDRARVGRVSHYLPALVMPVRGVAWLKKALISGSVSGRMLFHGNPAAFPFDENQGRFLARLDVQNAILDYKSGWTPIKGLGASVEFEGLSMKVSSDTGMIRGAKLEPVIATIDNMRQPRLVVAGEVSGKVQEMLQELGSSPLGYIYSTFIDRISVDGLTTLSLDLDLPLKGKNREYGINGKLALDGNNLRIAEQNITLEKITGDLSFTNHDLRGKNLKARLLDSPVTVNVSPEIVDGASSTAIRITGLKNLIRRIGGPDNPAAKILSGSSPWDITLQIRDPESRDKPPSVSAKLYSSMKGVKVDLPHPLGKSANSVRQLVVELKHAEQPGDPVFIRYGNVFRALLLHTSSGDKQGRIQGTVHFGADTPVLPDRPVLRITGTLPRLVPREWLRHASVIGQGGQGKQPVALDIIANLLEISGYTMQEVGVRSEQAGSFWNVHLSGPSVRGLVEFAPRADEPDRFSMNLEYLRLDKAENGDRSNAAETFRPGSVPQLQVSVKQLVYDNIQLGQFNLSTVTDEDGITAEKLHVYSDLLKVYASGRWTDRNGRQETELEAEVEGSNIGKLLTAFGYEESIDNGTLRGKANVRWKGTPADFSIAGLHGDINLLIRDGRLLEVEPGAGRVFGLLTLETLQRRLSLDFSDLFKKGFDFKKMEGDFSLVDGDAYTSDFFIEGPSARIEISGRTGLTARDYDQYITVIPNVSTTLPLAGAIALNPAVGVALLVADQVFSKQTNRVDSITRKKYTVTGSWENPDIERVERIEFNNRARELVFEEE